jgi:hypothetical protein
LSKTEADLSDDFQHLVLNKYHIYRDKNLSVYLASAKIDVVILGVAVIPSKGQYLYGDAVAQYIAQADSYSQVINRISQITGRFVCLFVINDSAYICSDAMGSKRVIINKSAATRISSSEKLAYGGDFKLSPPFSELADTTRYAAIEQYYPSKVLYNESLSLLLPNHVYNLTEGTEKRIDYNDIETYDDLSSIDVFEYHLPMTIKALSENGHNVLVPLTAGYDSRLLFSASLEYKEKVKYYIFECDEVDTSVAKQLAERFSLKLHVYTAEIKPSPQILEMLKNQHPFPRLLDKHAFLDYEIAYGNDKDIYINGLGGEIIRDFYGAPPKFFQAELIALSSGYGLDKGLIAEIKTWIKAQKNLTCNNKCLLDFFYWEYKMGIWSSRCAFENDLVHDEISLLNNRSLLIAILKNISRKQRTAPDYQVFTDYIDFKLGKTEIPYNANKKPAIEQLKRNIYARSLYFLLKPNKKI